MNYAHNALSVAFKSATLAKKDAAVKCLSTMKLKNAEWFQSTTVKLPANMKTSTMM